MYGIAKTHDDFAHPHAIRILNHFQGYTKNSLSALEEKEWVEIKGQKWSLTQKGFREAKDLYNQQPIND
jgi:manganese/zinc/iron transport system permease protein